MAIAPFLFDSFHASKALQIGLTELFGEDNQIGIKTLSTHDCHYRDFYDNSYCFNEQNGDVESCGGWSYHNVN